MKEIEKKWYCKDFPQKFYQHDTYFIVQNYVSLTAYEQLRIRTINNIDYYLTYKQGEGSVRKEMETSISKELYNHLCDLINKEPIFKERTQIPIGDYTAILDVFHLKNQLLKIVEVEFDSVEEMNNFEKPDWFGEKCSWSNKDLWEEINN